MLGIIAKLRGREFLGNVTVFMMGRELADYLRGESGASLEISSRPVHFC